MSIDLKQLETISIEQHEKLAPDESALVIIKMEENYTLPHYVKVRGYISKHIVTAQVDAYTFNQLIEEKGLRVELNKKMKLV